MALISPNITLIKRNKADTEILVIYSVSTFPRVRRSSMATPCLAALLSGLVFILVLPQQQTFRDLILLALCVAVGFSWHRALSSSGIKLFCDHAWYSHADFDRSPADPRAQVASSASNESRRLYRDI